MTSKSYKAWLQYDQIHNEALRQQYAEWLGDIVITEISDVLDAALAELQSGAASMLGIQPNIWKAPAADSCMIVGTVEADLWPQVGLTVQELAAVKEEGFLLKMMPSGDDRRLVLAGGSDRGVLYGVFHLLRLLSMEKDLIGLDVIDAPHARLRMMNQWDNADGSIERGYAGRSIFYRDGKIATDLQRVRDYARLLASVGINSISINNVNVHETETKFITAELLPDVACIADVLRSYGIRMFLSINFAAPVQIGGLPTADPLDEAVQDWWSRRADEIYRYIPDFGGFLVKADSEHRPGPFTYDRDHADGANMLAEALKPHGGLVIWRCFVYNCMQDWRDRSTDRARAAYDHFKPLDGRFHPNVILQIKNGPMDFQVREPVSPLFGALEKTNQLMEFQITQEYTGQQRHLCYLVPQWKEVVEFDTYAQGEGSTVKRIVDGTLYGNAYNGYAAVSNIGDDDNWTGHDLAQANLYGYGRLIWDPDMSAETIADEWVRLTFGNDERTVHVIGSMLMRSWPIYESYTSPLGVGWMITPHTHYGPDVDGYEYSRWGTYHFADRDGIGVDRTLAGGTGYSAQYHSPNAEMYDSLETCPDELLLFFHHVPYSHKLKSGETVIQHIYNTHFEGADQAAQLLKEWAELEGKIDEERYAQVRDRLAEQAEHAGHWRDVINTYFYRKSGVPDAKGRRIYI